jgi:predicted metal-dependent hydrolase
MKLLRPSADPPGVQMELPLLDPAADAAPAVPDAVAWPRPQPNARRLQLGERSVHYTLKRSTRRTIGFTVDDRGLSITAPRWVSLADIEVAIGEKQRWIFSKLGEWQHRQARRVLPTVQWREGACLPFLGKSITLRLGSPAGILLFDADRLALHLALPDHAEEQQIKDRVQGWLQQQARRLLSERLDVYADRLGVRHSAFALTSAATRWGSCTADGKIRLNWRLMHFPLSMIDYVVAHELAHLKEMNHGPRFWDTVASIFPDFRDARAQLKAHPPEMLPTF